MKPLVTAVLAVFLAVGPGISIALSEDGMSEPTDKWVSDFRKSIAPNENTLIPSDHPAYDFVDTYGDTLSDGFDLSGRAIRVTEPSYGTTRDLPSSSSSDPTRDVASVIDSILGPEDRSLIDFSGIDPRDVNPFANQIAPSYTSGQPTYSHY
ncbi:MAG: hypothetical protein HY391_06165 [Deltaproteobacteria bacterium]|nr:hypothetical protein [Deltaproteobacteria bacterium]